MCQFAKCHIIFRSVRWAPYMLLINYIGWGLDKTIYSGFCSIKRGRWLVLKIQGANYSPSPEINNISCIPSHFCPVFSLWSLIFSMNTEWLLDDHSLQRVAATARFFDAHSRRLSTCQSVKNNTVNEVIVTFRMKFGSLIKLVHNRIIIMLTLTYVYCTVILKL